MIGFRFLVVRTSNQILVIDLPEKNKVSLQRINSNFVRFINTESKPAKVFAEVMSRGVAIQSAFSDDMGLFRYDGVGVLRVYDGDDMIDFGIVEEIPAARKSDDDNRERYVTKQTKAKMKQQMYKEAQKAVYCEEEYERPKKKKKILEISDCD